MNSVINVLFVAIALLVCSQTANAGLDCQGKFPNLATDICWSCAFPIRIGGVPLSVFGQEDTPSPGGMPVCTCGVNPGLKVSFWEPIRHVDVVRKPFCMTALGGLDMNPDLMRRTEPKRSSTTPVPARSIRLTGMSIPSLL